jgi:RNA polymerase sigma-70 factor (ECF subfamily)
MLAQDVALDLVGRFQAKGRDQVGEYLHRYALADQWHFAAGLVDGHPAMLVFDRRDPGDRPVAFVALDFSNAGVVRIRDFLLARYALDGAELLALR